MVSVIGKSKEEEYLLRIVDEALKPMGFRVIDIDYEQNVFMKLFIEYLGNVDGQKQQVTINDCAKISLFLSDYFKNISWLREPYTLEVSSPGLDRRLRIKADFEEAIGSRVKLRLKGAKKVLEGVLTFFSGDTVVIKVGDNEKRILLSDVRRANTIYNGDVF